MKKLYAVSMIHVRKQLTMQGALYVGLAESADEAAKLASEEMAESFPAYKGWRPFGAPSVMEIADDLIYSAHENLKAAENARTN